MSSRTPRRLTLALVALVLVTGMPGGGLHPDEALAAAPRQARRSCALPRGTDPVSVTPRLLRRAPSGWLAGDLTHSVALPDGRIVWLFGDTFVGRRRGDGGFAPGWRMDRNSALVQKGRCLSVAGSNGGQGWVSTKRRDHFLWPGHGVVTGDELVVLFHEMRATGSGFLDVRPAGLVIATFSLPELRLVGTRRGPYDDHERAWASSAVTRGGWVYLYGWTHRGPDTFVARARPARLAKRWQFWTGSEWVWDRPERAAPVISYGFFNNVNVSEDGAGGYVAVAKDHEAWGDDLLLWRAPRPEGPWTAAGPVAPAPPDAEGADGAVTYMAAPHDVGARRGRRAWVTYNVNAPTLAAVTSGRVRYGPRFTRLDLRPAA
jgi:hypothetical protein